MKLTLGLRVCFTATTTPSLWGAGRLYSMSILLSIHGSLLLAIVFVRSVFREAVWMSILLHTIIHLDNSQSFLQYGLHLWRVHLLNRKTLGLELKSSLLWLFKTGGLKRQSKRTVESSELFNLSSRILSWSWVSVSRNSCSNLSFSFTHS